MRYRKMWRRKYAAKVISPKQAADMIKSGDTIACCMGHCVPYEILNELADRASELENVLVLSGNTARRCRLTEPQCRGHIKYYSSFFSAQDRAARNAGGNIELTPMHLSRLCESRLQDANPDFVMILCGPPDEDGNMSLGIGALEKQIFAAGKTVVAQVSASVPYVKCESMLNVKDADWLVPCEADLNNDLAISVSDSDRDIANSIVELIPDGACLQLGFGNVPEAVGEYLKDKRDLGIHSELFTESMMNLMECGAVTNSRKRIKPGKSVYAFRTPKQILLPYLDNNPNVEVMPFSWVNDPYIASQNDNFISINGAIEIDLTGQVCAESIGHVQFSATGGQLDFVRSAAMSRGGKSFIAMPSLARSKDGKYISRLVLSLKPGAIVTTPRADVDYVVTEYGCVQLKYCSIDERAKKLISIAHPDFRDKLMYDAKKIGLII